MAASCRSTGSDTPAAPNTSHDETSARGERVVPVNQLLVVSASAFAVAVLAMMITAVVARRVDRASIVDVTWGVGLTVISVVCAILNNDWLPWLMAALVTVWGLRLSWHIWHRSRGHGEDPRYVELLAPHSP